MKLRSNRVFKVATPKVSSNVKKEGFSVERRLLSERKLSLRSNKSYYDKRGAREAESGSCVDSFENLGMGRKETVSSDDKGLFLGSEVLDPIKDLAVSCSKEGTEEEEGNESMSMRLSEKGIDFKEDVKLPHVEFEDGSKRLELETLADDLVVVNGDDEEEEGNESVSMRLSEKGLDFKEDVELPHVEFEDGSRGLGLETLADDLVVVNGDDDEEGNESMCVRLSETGLGIMGDVKSPQVEFENGSKSMELETLADDLMVVNSDDEEDGNESVSIRLSETGLDFKEDVKSLHVDIEDGSKSLELETFSDDLMVVNGDDEEEENESMSIRLSEKALDFKEVVKSPHIEFEHVSKSLEPETFADNLMVNGDDDKETSLNDPGNANKSGKCNEIKEKDPRGRKKKNVRNVKKIENYQEKIDVDFGVSGDDDDECTLMSLKDKSRKKRKSAEASGSKSNGTTKKEKVEKDGVQVVLGLRQCERTLRSKNPTIASDDAVTVVDSGNRAVVLGLRQRDDGPKKMLKCHGRPRKLFTEGENTRPKKKLKKRLEPCELQNDIKPLFVNEIPMKKVERRGRPRKLQGELEVKPVPLNEIPGKKLERRGRPRKILGETTHFPLNEIPMKKLERRGRPRIERRGRPRKVSHEIVSGPVESCGTKPKLYGKGTFKKFKRRGRPPKMDARTLATHVIKMKTVNLVKKSRKNCETGEFLNVEKGIIGGKLQRKQLKQLIRDKISDVLLKCGWTVTFRQRQEKLYMDSVFVEPNGKNSHWSVTAAYAKLKRKIENGIADNIEMSAFSPIPEEEISILYRHHEKKKKRNSKDVKKGKIGTNKKKKHGKKSKDGSKRKMIFKPRFNANKQDNLGVSLTKKLSLLSWMIDSGDILAGTKVQYGKTRRQKRSYEGVITSDGICCGCCNETMGITRFVVHCGGKSGQVFDNLFLESGTCLRKCLTDTWRKEKESNINRFHVVDVQGDDPNDDACNICGDGGDLICCDGCPSTFHQSCLDVQNIPSGDWNCIYCTCKFCGDLSVSTPQVEDPRDAISSPMLSCCLCEEKFHQLCLQEVEDVNEDSNILPFCGKKCYELFERLQTHLGVKHELEDGFSWTLLKRSDVDQDLSKVEPHSKLAVAFSVMDECFVPIIDEKSGTNIIRNVVYNCGSNFKRLNYAGFLTAVLEKDDEFITAASIRIHGYRLAEMPFIGTRHVYRRQGMCRRLLDAIESTLSSLGVEELIIPAIPALLQTWTDVFGFMPLDELKKQEMKCMSIMVFPGIDMLKKPLLHNHSADVEQTSADKPGIGKDVINCEQTEKQTVLMDCYNCPDLESDKSTISHGVNSLCDLNLPVKNVVPCNTDGQTPVDSKSFPDVTIEPRGDMESIAHGVKVKPSLLTSKPVLKNTFDLNLHPTAVETDVHIISQTASKTCEGQPLAMR